MISAAAEGTRQKIVAHPVRIEDMLRIFPVVFMAAAAFSQTQPADPGKAPVESAQRVPPDLDAALRARISKFYQLEVEGKFSQALQLVADDTKDLFVGTSKPTYRGFEIQSIHYSDDFTQAQVFVLVTRLMPVEGFLGHPVPTKQASRWKLENGLWCFYVNPQTDLPASPFGPVMRPGMAAAPTVVPGAQTLPPPAGVPPTVTTAPNSTAMPNAAPGGRPLPPPVAIPAHLGALTQDKPNVRLKTTGPSADQVAITNPAPWPVTIALRDPKIPGLKAKLDRETLKTGEKAILRIESADGARIPHNPITIVVTVPRTNQVIPIRVSFVN